MRKETIVNAPICPLFTAHSDKEIICKSHMTGADRVSLLYWSKANLEMQLTLFCGQNYKKCEHYLSYKHFKWEDE